MSLPIVTPVVTYDQLCYSYRILNNLPIEDMDDEYKYPYNSGKVDYVFTLAHIYAVYRYNL